MPEGGPALPRCLDRFRSVQQAISASPAADPFDGITDSDVEDAAPECSLIDDSVKEIVVGHCWLRLKFFVRLYRVY